MSAAAAIQRAIYERLRADATLATLLAADAYEGSPSGSAIYDHVPQSDQPEDTSLFPYVVIGDNTAAPFDTDAQNGQETTITLHVWDRQLGTVRAKQVIDAIYAALHDAPLEVAGHSMIFCYFEFGESVPDPEPLTKHEVARYRIATQQ